MASTSSGSKAAGAAGNEVAVLDPAELSADATLIGYVPLLDPAHPGILPSTSCHDAIAHARALAGAQSCDELERVGSSLRVALSNVSDQREILLRSFALLDEHLEENGSPAERAAWLQAIGRAAEDDEHLAIPPIAGSTLAAWRETASSALRSYSEMLAKVEQLIAEHTPWPSLSDMPLGDIHWSRSASFAKALLSLLLFLAQLTERKHERKWRLAVPHALMAERLKEAIDKADKGYGWGRSGLNEALRELRKKYAEEDDWRYRPKAEMLESAADEKGPVASKLVPPSLQLSPLPDPPLARTTRSSAATTSSAQRGAAKSIYAGTTAPVKQFKKRSKKQQQQPVIDSPANEDRDEQSPDAIGPPATASDEDATQTGPAGADAACALAAGAASAQAGAGVATPVEASPSAASALALKGTEMYGAMTQDEDGEADDMSEVEVLPRTVDKGKGRAIDDDPDEDEGDSESRALQGHKLAQTARVVRRVPPASVLRRPKSPIVLSSSSSSSADDAASDSSDSKSYLTIPPQDRRRVFVRSMSLGIAPTRISGLGPPPEYHERVWVPSSSHQLAFSRLCEPRRYLPDTERRQVGLQPFKSEEAYIRDGDKDSLVHLALRTQDQGARIASVLMDEIEEGLDRETYWRARALRFEEELKRVGVPLPTDMIGDGAREDGAKIKENDATIANSSGRASGEQVETRSSAGHPSTSSSRTTQHRPRSPVHKHHDSPASPLSARDRGEAAHVDSDDEAVDAAAFDLEEVGASLTEAREARSREADMAASRRADDDAEMADVEHEDDESEESGDEETEREGRSTEPELSSEEDSGEGDLVHGEDEDSEEDQESSSDEADEMDADSVQLLQDHGTSTDPTSHRPTPSPSASSPARKRQRTHARSRGSTSSPAPTPPKPLAAAHPEPRPPQFRLACRGQDVKDVHADLLIADLFRASKYSKKITCFTRRSKKVALRKYEYDFEGRDAGDPPELDKGQLAHRLVEFLTSDEPVPGPDEWAALPPLPLLSDSGEAELPEAVKLAREELAMGELGVKAREQWAEREERMRLAVKEKRVRVGAFFEER